MGMWARRLWDALSAWSTISGLLASRFVSVYLAPLLSSAVVMAVGHFADADLPLMYVLLGGIWGLAGTAFALNQISQWREAQRVADKLSFGHVRVLRYRDTTDIVIGVVLKNNANFPLRCDVVKFETRLGDRIPRATVILPKTIEVPARGELFFDDHNIDTSPARNETAQGAVSFEIHYGRGDRRKAVLIGRKSVYVRFDDEGKMKSSSWHDA